MTDFSRIDLPTCGALFTVMGFGRDYDGDHWCTKERLHLDGPHQSNRGFMWGMADQTRDPHYIRLSEHDRRMAEKRAKSAQRWYRKLANRGYVKPSQRASG